MEDEQMITKYFEAIVDSFPFEVWFKDANSKYRIANKFILNDLNKSRIEVIGKNDYEIYPKHYADRYMDTDRAVIEEGLVGYYISEYKDKIYEEYKSPIFDKSGMLIGISGFSKDITQAREIQNALIESERSISVLLSNLPGVAYRSACDSNFQMIFLSEGCYELTGYKPEELLGQKLSYYDLIYPEYRNILFEKWKKSIGLDLIMTDEYPIKTASGETKWVCEKFQEVYDAERNVVATEGFIIDITERKNAEKSLKQSEERFRAIFEEAPLGIGIFNSLNGKSYQVNDRFAEILGRTKEEILQISWMEYSHPNDIQENLEKLELLNSKKIMSFSIDKRLIRPDGSVVWANITVAPCSYDDNSKSHVCMIEDISDKKRAEEEVLYLSFHDQLTGLYNHRFYVEALKRFDIKENLPLTLVMGDVNGLKLINDSLGHAMGDELIKKAAGVIKSECRPGDMIARIGGDEFIILLPKTDSLEGAKIIDRISEQSLREKVGFASVSISFGYETKNNEEEKIEDIFKKAEDKMYEKKQPRNQGITELKMSSIIASLYNKNRREEQHCNRVSQLCESMAAALGLPAYEIVKLKMVALLHDIGKVVIDENILNKPGRLTDIEWGEIKRHSEMGYRILSASNDMAEVAGCVLSHHERWDGHGYPKGLKEEQIPLMSRIIAIADAYDAMTSERSYKNALQEEVAVLELRNNAGTQFDPELVNKFIGYVLHK